MAAGVHDADFEAVLVAHADLAGVGHAGLLDDRQRIHVGADQDGRPGAVLQDADDAGAADFLASPRSRALRSSLASCAAVCSSWNASSGWA